MHIKTLVVAAFKHSIDTAAAKFEVEHALHQNAQGGVVRLVPVRAGSCGSDGGGLCGQHNFIRIFLRRAEFSVDRKGARDVGGVAIQFTGGIYQQQIAIFQSCIVTDVMQHTGVGTPCHDRSIGWALRAAVTKFVQQFSLDFVFHFAGAGGAHGAHMRSSRNIGRPTHGVDFGAVFD